ncbi:MAG: hypothetical protein AAFX99_17880, partial [Myxococcota bacterium]
MFQHTHPLAHMAAALAVLALAVACGDDGTGTAAQFNDTSNGTTAPTSNDTTDNTSNTETTPANNDTSTPMDMAALERLGEQTQAVNANSTLTLQVRYLGTDGNPGVNEAIDWNIIGEASGTQLDARQDTTDDSGISEMIVRSATMEASFEVEASVAADPELAVRFT